MTIFNIFPLNLDIDCARCKEIDFGEDLERNTYDFVSAENLKYDQRTRRKVPEEIMELFKLSNKYYARPKRQNWLMSKSKPLGNRNKDRQQKDHNSYDEDFGDVHVGGGAPPNYADIKDQLMKQMPSKNSAQYPTTSQTINELAKFLYEVFQKKPNRNYETEIKYGHRRLLTDENGLRTYEITPEKGEYIPVPVNRLATGGVYFYGNVVNKLMQRRVNRPNTRRPNRRVSRGY